MGAVGTHRYPKWQVGIASLPLYFAAGIPLIILIRPGWLIFLCFIPFWLAIDFFVSRIFTRQVLIQGRQRWQVLSSIAGIGLLLNVFIIASTYVTF